MTYNIDMEELNNIKELSELGNALIVDLTKLKVLVASPVPHINAICSCRNTEIEYSHHCIKCGSSYAKIGVGLNSYELYSVIYKFIEIHSKNFDAVVFITDDVIPLDFVGSLNRFTWIYLPKLPYRRKIIHITNDIVHTDDFFTKAGLSEHIRDRVSYISIFSSKKEVMDIHKSKILHSARINPWAYLDLILGSSGFPYRYYIS